MQDEITEKAVNLAVRVGKLSYETGKKAIEKLIAELEKNGQSAKTAQKTKTTQKANKKPEFKQGKQTLNQLRRQNDGLSSMELKNPNLRLLNRIMKKHNIDFAPVKDGKGKYILFFKGKDADVLTHAFKKYTQMTIKLARPKPPIQKVLAAAKAASKAIDTGRGKEKTKSRGAR